MISVRSKYAIILNHNMYPVILGWTLYVCLTVSWSLSQNMPHVLLSRQKTGASTWRSVTLSMKQLKGVYVVRDDRFLFIWSWQWSLTQCIWTPKLHLKLLKVIVFDQSFLLAKSLYLTIFTLRPPEILHWYFNNLTTHAHIHGSVNAHMTGR